MTNQTAITITNLSKTYRLRAAAPADNLREVISLRIRNLRRPKPSQPVSFQALKNINLQIPAGAMVGIIGKNGAGKSTLLKILSRVTEPTYGSFCLVGKVAALLEIGVGFHPDLTGRENIYLNGALLGLRRTAIQERLPAIHEFAEIGNFIDLPVKKYSSGMYVRLAFAIAAFLDADVLLIDEVLAVGDSAFQQKCLHKIQEINQNGTTILFVSHNLQAVERLCPRCLVLTAGELAFDGPTAEALAFYRDQILGKSSPTMYSAAPDAGSAFKKAQIKSLRLCNLHGVPITTLETGEGCQLQLTIMRRDPNIREQCTLYLRSLDNYILLRLAPRDVGFNVQTSAREYQLNCTLPMLNLMPNRYLLDVHLYDQAETIEFIEAAVIIEIVPSARLMVPVLADTRFRGVLHISQEWSLTA